MRLRTTTRLLLLISVSVSGLVNAGMFRWVDEDGVTVYSQTPPPSGDSIRLKNAPGPPPAEAEAARKRLEQQIQESFDAGEAKEQATKEQAEKDEKARIAQENCTSAQGNLDKFQNLGRRMVLTAEGRYLRLSEDQVETQIRKAQGQIDEYCK